MKSLSPIVAIAVALALGNSVSADAQDHLALLAKGKVEADLGHYASAADVFRAVANNTSVPSKARWEALVRLGLVQSAAGDTRASLETFGSVFAQYASDAIATRFATGAIATGVPGRMWLPCKPQLEELLRTAPVISAVDLRMAGPSAKIVRLEWDDFEVKAVWRPVDRNGPSRSGRSSSAEQVAYEIDKLIGLDMVPPTVARNLDGQAGAVQFWVNNARTYRPGQQMPSTGRWEQQVSRMKLFDSLIGNSDRNLANTMVDRDDTIMLVDHSLAFSSERSLKDPPRLFDRRLVEKLRALDTAASRAALKPLLTDSELQGLLARRDALLAHLAKLVAEQGEAAVLFE